MPTRQPREPENWYDRHGVDRPAEFPHLTWEELEKKFEEIRANTKHGKWTQMGNRLTCNNCNPTHTSEPISPEYLLQGTDDQGLPILKKLDLTPKE